MGLKNEASVEVALAAVVVLVRGTRLRPQLYSPAEFIVGLNGTENWSF